MTNSFKKVALVLSVFAIIFSFSARDVFADTVTTNFETFTDGSVNGQGGWSVDSGTPYDQEVVDNTYGYSQFGTKVWRISNKTHTSFFPQIYTPSNTNEVGEITATNAGLSGGTRQNRFEASFDFASAQSTGQDYLTVEVSPDRGDGARMGTIGIADHSTTGGLYVYIIKSLGEGNPNSFGFEYIKTNLSREVVHNLKYVIDVYDGSNNDVLNVYIDNQLVYTGTTWEDYYYFGTESAPNTASRTMDSLLFRVPFSGTNTMTGILVDNISITTSNRNQEVWVDDVATNGDGTQANPFNTIAEGVAKVATGGIVHVAPGAYTESVTVSKAMTVQSTTSAVLTGSIAINSSNVVVTGLTVVNPNSTATGTIDLSTLIPSGTGTLPQMTVASSLSTVVLDIPASTTVTAPGWNGILQLPTAVAATSVSAPAIANQTVTVDFAISVGSTVPMSFDKGVRLLFPNEAGKKVGFSYGNDPLTEITAVCSADTQTVGDALPVSGNCVITAGPDLVVWTKHFTTFATFSTTTNTTNVRATRVIGSGGASRAATTIAQASVTPVIPNTPSPAGQVLSAQTYVFTINQKIGARGHADVKELQKYLNKRTFSAGVEDGIFGSKTQVALKAFQKASGISPDGLVGPMTRSVLNK